MSENIKIRALRIKNFRKFEDIEINFSNWYSAIVWENWEGKTTILEAIDFALSPSFTASKVSYDDFYNWTENPITIEIKFDWAFEFSVQDWYNQRSIPCNWVYLEISKRDWKTPNKAFSDAFTIKHYCIPCLSEGWINKTNKWFSMLRNNGKTYFEFQENALTLSSRAQTTLPKCFYFSKKRERNLYKWYNSSWDTIINEFNWRFNKKLRVNDEIQYDYTNSINDFENIIKNSLDEKVMDNTIMWMNDKLSEFFWLDNLWISFIDKSAPFNQSYLNYQNFNIDYSWSWIMLIIAFVLLDVLANLSKWNVIILVDEPELHLHPQLQKKLFNYISNSENQFIYTTHSNILISIKDWGNIIRIYDNMCSNVNKIVGEDRKNLEDMVNFYQYATVFLRENNDLFFSKKVIIVEWPIDKYCIPILIVKFWKWIKVDDLTIIQANGKDNIKNYALICKVFGVLAMSIYDKDNDSKPKPKEDEIIESLSIKSYSFGTSFESVLWTKKGNHKANETIIKVNELETCPEEFMEMIESIKMFISL